MFLWTVAHNAIMTNDMRWRRRLTDNRCCYHCVNEVETLMHAVRDCPSARRIWEVFVRVEEKDLFFSQNWYTWLISNLSSRNRGMRNEEWNLIFGVTIWYIWKERCSRTFEGDRGNWFGTVLTIRRMVEDSKNQLQSGNGSNGDAKIDNIGWKYPVEEWIKLNVDGCSKGNPGMAGTGGVIRDHMGTWVGGLREILVIVRP